MFTVVVISNYMHWLMESFFLGLFIYFGTRDLSMQCMGSLAVICGHCSSAACGILTREPGIQPTSRANSLPLDHQEEIPAHGLFNVILQVWKLRLREGKCAAQGHTAGRCQS